jgi:serine-type D-Ala-D-Ala carboxypeptidase (penicillin-binding protein 5/6)
MQKMTMTHIRLSKLEYLIGGSFLVLLFFLVAFVYVDSRRDVVEATFEQVDFVDEVIVASESALRENVFSEIPLVARAAVVYDILADEIIFGKNENEPMHLASITKIMTALVAHENKADTGPIVIRENALAQYGNSGLILYEQWNKRDLLDFTLMVSSNEGAFALASAVGAYMQIGSVNNSRDIFISEMNRRAREIGMEKTTFLNESGLDLDNGSQSGGFGTAMDTGILFSYILKNYPELLEATRYSDFVFTSLSGFVHKADNTNRLTRDIPGLIASKTGYTDLAGGNLTVVFDAELMRPVVITVLGSTRDDRFTDVYALLEGTLQYFRLLSANTTEDSSVEIVDL